MDIISAYREVGTYRGAAAICGTTHKTVKRVDRPPRVRRRRRRPRAPRGRNYDAVAELVAERVEKIAGPDHRRSGCCRSPGRRAMRGRRATSGGWSRTQKALWRRDNHRGRRPAVWSPGEHLVIDWGVLGGLHVFCAVLAWSRCAVRALRRRRARRHDAGAAGGVLRGARRGPGVVLADRMGCLKGGVVANVVVPDRRTTCGSPRTTGSGPDFCEAADPESKGIVENLVGYAKTDLMIPGADGSGDGRSPTSPRRTPRPRRGVPRSTPRCTRRSARCPAERLVIERELLAAAAVAAGRDRPRR